jgi:hypothetical protein
MGHATYGALIEQLVAARDADYRADPDRQEAMLNAYDSVLLALLEKLRDQFEAG